MLLQLNPNLAYKPLDVDMFLDDTRNEGEVRMVPLRAALRALACKAKRPCLLDITSDNSIGSMIASNANSRRTAFESIMKVGGCGRICLIAPNVRLLHPEQADELDEASRAKCIPLLGSDKLATEAENTNDSRVVVRVPCSECGGGERDGMVVATRQGDCDIELLTRSSAGKRNSMSACGIPKQLLDNLFRRTDVSPCAPIPEKRNELPYFLKSALASFLERRMRLQVLCTAQMPAPVSRPVALDRVFLQPLDKRKIIIQAHLHPSSATCICGKSNSLSDWSSRVEVKLETCGHVLKKDVHGRLTCGVHARILDDCGNSRNRIQDFCTEATRVCVTCRHRNGSELKSTLCVHSIPLTGAGRKELALILVRMNEFEARTAQSYSGVELRDRDRVAAVQEEIEARFRSEMQQIEIDQLSKDCDSHTARELLKRDMTAVDLLREGGVFRHVHKSGLHRGCPYIRRIRGKEALKSHETELNDTHTHLFPKA